VKTTKVGQKHLLFFILKSKSQKNSVFRVTTPIDFCQENFLFGLFYRMVNSDCSNTEQAIGQNVDFLFTDFLIDLKISNRRF
jgi:hypothetical protein